MRRSYREKTNDKYDRDLFGLGLFISLSATNPFFVV